MKRFFSLFLLVTLLLSFTGCGFWGTGVKDPVTFYYPRAEYAYGVDGSIIGSETWEASGHTGDLPYLLALYLVGPSDENLMTLFPKSIKLISAEKADGSIYVELSDIADALTDAEFSLACVCLTLTCLEITDAEAVTITSGEHTLTMSPDNLRLYDEYIPITTTEETQ